MCPVSLQSEICETSWAFLLHTCTLKQFKPRPNSKPPGTNKNKYPVLKPVTVHTLAWVPDPTSPHIHAQHRSLYSGIGSAPGVERNHSAVHTAKNLSKALLGRDKFWPHNCNFLQHFPRDIQNSHHLLREDELSQPY